MRALKLGLSVVTLLGCLGTLAYVTDAGAQFVAAPMSEDLSATRPVPVTPPPSAVTPRLPVRPAPMLTPDPTADITLQIGGLSSVYKRASLQNLSQAFIKLTGVDLNDDVLIDDFAIINHCDIYTRYFKDEFSWRQAREAFRRVIQRELESYPENVYMLGSLTLGRYDFERKAFMLDEESKFVRTGAFAFSDRGFSCPGGVVKQLPLTYNFRLTNPITLDRFEVPEEKAFTITRIMEQEQNRDRKVYLSFFIRINDFTTQNEGGSAGLRATTRATLMSMRVYLDRQRKIQIYEYTGTN